MELKASQEKSISQVSELHVKEVEVLQSQVNKLKQGLSSSEEKNLELEKLVSELQQYKEQAQVSASPLRYRYYLDQRFLVFLVSNLLKDYCIY